MAQGRGSDFEAGLIERDLLESLSFDPECSLQLGPWRQIGLEQTFTKRSVSLRPFSAVGLMTIYSSCENCGVSSANR